MFKLSLVGNVIKDIVYIKLVYSFVMCQIKHIYEINACYELISFIILLYGKL